MVYIASTGNRMISTREEGESMLPNHRRTDPENTSSATKESFPSRTAQLLRKAVLAIFSSALLYCIYTMLVNGAAVLAMAGTAQVAMRPTRELNYKPTTTVPQYFQTYPELWPGPTATGKAPFLRQTDPVSFGPSVTFVPNTPLETSMPIVGNYENQSIFHLMGHLSPYSPNPVGFGVDEFPLPPGANITHLQMLSRHGSRYPTTDSNVASFGERISKSRDKFQASGLLSFLNDWKYELGAEILVPLGRQELFESGVLHYYQYGQLYNPNSKIIARTTTQDRMLKSAEYFMAGFFGLDWTQNVTLEVIIEADGFNNSLAGYLNCNNSKSDVNAGGAFASNAWLDIYLQNATARLQTMIKGYKWTIEDSYAAQTLCPYETIANGYSPFCSLFSYEEYVHFSYSVDLAFAGEAAFQSPVGRAIGLGYVQETIARLENHTLGYSGSQINVTLDNNTETFPLNQNLYFDFSHDTNIMSILTSFGFTQFAGLLNETAYPGPHNLTVGHLEPFAARLDIEVIKTPSPLDASRTYIPGNETTYIHFVLNQRTLPLGVSFPACGEDRLDGWCELTTFLRVQNEGMKLADFDYACFGSYDAVPYGTITNGAPLRPG